ncbi:MAG: sulfite exporter TauE/SafE family protein [Deltaproteobacteria bacterium]|nr:sulfite exporter TauE/SafE family protein [Deltaproteobacteria bacterium]
MSLVLLLSIIFFASLILTMVGLGGGLIFSPLFVLLNFPISMAVSASLFLNGISAVSAAIVYMRKKMVDFSVSFPLIVTSTISAPLGALVTHKINLKVFLMIMATAILAAALRMLLSKAAVDRRVELSRLKSIVGGGMIGLAIGFLAGLLGIGGGVFIVPMLIFLLGIPAKTAAASSIFIVCFSSFSGFISHASIGTIDWKFILLAALFSFTGGQIGSRIMAEKLKGRTVRIIFGIVLLAFSIKLFHKAFL